MKLFVAGKQCSSDYRNWEIMGIFDNKEDAESMCFDRYYFVGPMTLNEPLPEETTGWPGIYYPRADG